jgi:hypothetical protein
VWRSDHVHDSLALVAQTSQPHAEIPAVPLERRHHVLGHDVQKRPCALPGWNDVVGRREGAVRTRDLPSALTQRVEGLGTRDLVHEMEAHEHLRLPGRQLADGVEIPHLLKQRLTHGVVMLLDDSS